MFNIQNNLWPKRNLVLNLKQRILHCHNINIIKLAIIKEIISVSKTQIRKTGLYKIERILKRLNFLYNTV